MEGDLRQIANTKQMYNGITLITLHVINNLLTQSAQRTRTNSNPGVWLTMLQAAKRGASSLPIFALANSTAYYFHSLPRVAILSQVSPSIHILHLHPHK